MSVRFHADTPNIIRPLYINPQEAHHNQTDKSYRNRKYK